MSNTYGVAKAANAISVRVLDTFGFGSYAYVASHNVMHAVECPNNWIMLCVPSALLQFNQPRNRLGCSAVLYCSNPRSVQYM